MISDDFIIENSNSSEEYNQVIKTVFVGSQAVGKTNLFTRIDQDVFREDSKATIGVDFAFKQVQF